MGRWLAGILDNDSAFGQIMTRCGIIIGANLCFLIFSIPIVTIGPALAALYRVCLRTLRSDGVINPFREFWIGFKQNAKQGFAFWLLLIAFVLLGIADIRFCMAAGGIFTWFRYAIYVLGFAALVLTVYIFPVMAAFEDTLPHLLRNAVFFAAKNPIRLLVLVFMHVFPFLVTYLDERMQPLYVFLWAVCGFAAIAMLTSSMLLKDFARYLPKPDEPDEDELPGADEASHSPGKSLKEMKKLGM